MPNALARSATSLPIRPRPATPLPPPSLEGGVGLRHVAGLGQQQRHGVLGGRDDIRLRRIHHHHPTPCRGLDVDVVEADTCAADHDQIVRRLEHLGRDLSCGADDQRVSADDVGQQLIEIELDIDHVAGATKPIEATIGDFFGHQDTRHAIILVPAVGFRPAV